MWMYVDILRFIYIIFDPIHTIIFTRTRIRTHAMATIWYEQQTRKPKKKEKLLHSMNIKCRKSALSPWLSSQSTLFFHYRAQASPHTHIYLNTLFMRINFARNGLETFSFRPFLVFCDSFRFMSRWCAFCFVCFVYIIAMANILAEIKTNESAQHHWIDDFVRWLFADPRGAITITQHISQHNACAYKFNVNTF